MSQEQLMMYCPAFRNPQPYPSHAKQYREFHGRVAWIFNPWTGEPRWPHDVGTDPFGELILTPEESAISNAKLDAACNRSRKS